MNPCQPAKFQDVSIVGFLAGMMLIGLVGLAGAWFGFSYVPDGPGPGPDLDCRNIGHQVRVAPGEDYHRLDRDGDGIGCEWDGKKYGWLGWIGLLLLGGAVTGGSLRYGAAQASG